MFFLLPGTGGCTTGAGSRDFYHPDPSTSSSPADVLHHDLNLQKQNDDASSEDEDQLPPHLFTFPRDTVISAEDDIATT